MQIFRTLWQPFLGDLGTVRGRKRKKKERLIYPKIVAYLSCSAGRTKFARTNCQNISGADCQAESGGNRVNCPSMGMHLNSFAVMYYPGAVICNPCALICSIAVYEKNLFQDSKKYDFFTHLFLRFCFTVISAGTRDLLDSCPGLIPKTKWSPVLVSLAGLEI